MADHLNLMKPKWASTVEELAKSENKINWHLWRELWNTKRALDDTRVDYDKLMENYDMLNINIKHI